MSAAPLDAFFGSNDCSLSCAAPAEVLVCSSYTRVVPISLTSPSEGNGADGLGKSVYEIITERILDKLEQGTVPWHKPWSAGGSPQNLITGRAYRGVNIFLLGCQGFASPFWELSANPASTRSLPPCSWERR